MNVARRATFRILSSSAHPGAIPRLRFHQRSPFLRSLLFVLLAAALTAAAGCASAPTYRASPELPQKRSGIRTVGLLPPVIELSEEQPRFGLNKLVEQVLWSAAAVDTVTRAFSEQMADDHIQLVQISTNDTEVNELVDLYKAVEYSINRHAWEKELGEMVPRETFPEKVRAFDYSLGPAKKLMERYHVDAVWFVRGFNRLPTTGTKVKEGLETLLSIMAAVGGHAAPAIQYKKVELRVALIDRDGNVLYYGVADEERAGQPVGELPGESAPAGELPALTSERPYLSIDLRDPLVARHYIKAALSGYRAGAAP